MSGPNNIHGDAASAASDLCHARSLNMPGILAQRAPGLPVVMVDEDENYCVGDQVAEGLLPLVPIRAREDLREEDVVLLARVRHEAQELALGVEARHELLRHKVGRRVGGRHHEDAVHEGDRGGDGRTRREPKRL